MRPDPETLEPLHPDQEKVVAKFRTRFSDAVLESQSFRKQLSIWIRRDVLLDALRLAQTEPDLLCDLLCDLTAVDYLDHRGPGEPRDEMVYNLSSIPLNHRFFLKCGLNDGESLPSATQVWKGANFMEREVYDLFGIHFDGHPNLERLALWTAPRWMRLARGQRSSNLTGNLHCQA